MGGSRRAAPSGSPARTTASSSSPRCSCSAPRRWRASPRSSSSSRVPRELIHRGRGQKRRRENQRSLRGIEDDTKVLVVRSFPDEKEHSWVEPGPNLGQTWVNYFLLWTIFETLD